MHLNDLVWLALLTAFLYSIAAILLKQALMHGCNPWQANFCANLAIMALAQFMWFFATPSRILQHWGIALAAGFIAAIGQFFAFIALLRGDASVATPLLGTKVVGVALFSPFFLGQSISPSWWAGVALSTAGVFVISASQPLPAHPQRSRDPFLTVFYSLLAAACFALNDLALAYGSRLAGTAGTLAMANLTLGIITAVVYPLLFGKRLFLRPPSHSLKWLGSGSLFLAMQSLGMGIAVAASGKPTVANILYSSRCVWSVLLAWLIAHHIGSAEAKLKHTQMLLRTAGATMLFIAILIALL